MSEILDNYSKELRKYIGMKIDLRISLFELSSEELLIMCKKVMHDADDIKPILIDTILKSDINFTG